MTTLLAGQESFVGGMNDGASAAVDFAPGQCSLMLNFRPDFDGSAVMRAGTVLVGTIIAGIPTRAQFWSFSTLAGAAHLVAAVDTALYDSTDAGQSWTSIATGLTAGWWSATIMRSGSTNYLVLANGTHCKKYDGTTLSDVAGIAAGVKYVVFANERLWYAGHDGNRAAAGAVDSLSVWAVPDGISLPVGDGGPVTGLATAFGRVVAYKDAQVATIEGFGNADVQTLSDGRGVSQSVGCPNFRTIVSLPSGGLAWRSRRGLEAWEGAAVQRIGLGVNTFLSDQNPALMGSRGMYYPARDEVWFTGDVPATHGGVAVNLTTGAAWRLQHLTLYDMAMVTSGTSVVPFGLFNGKVYQMESGNADGGASGITARLDSALFDFGQSARKKWGRCSRVTFAPATSTDTTRGAVDILANADGTDGNSHTAAAGAVPGRAVIGTSVRGFNLKTCVSRDSAVSGGRIKVLAMEQDAQLLIQGRR